MATYTLSDLLILWREGKLSLPDLIGRLLPHLLILHHELTTLKGRVDRLEGGSTKNQENGHGQT